MHRLAATLLAGLLLAAWPLALHSRAANGIIEGRVITAAGARVANAAVKASPVAGGANHQTTTDAKGAFRFTGLLPGAYRLTVEHVKYAAATRQVTVTDGQVVRTTVTLQAAAPKPPASPNTAPVQAPPSVRSETGIEGGIAGGVAGGVMGGIALPPRNSVRLEELINCFRYDYPDPKPDVPFSITTDVGPCPWNRAHLLAHIGLQARRLTRREAPPRNLVFLLDVSGSMEPADKLPLIKQGMQLLVNDLTPRDTVAIVVYATAAGVVLEPTSGDRRDVIRDAIDQLHAGGSTNGADGLQTAYRLARHRFDREGVNRVILGTDGDFNTGMVDRGDLVALIERERKAGIGLSILGVGTDNLKDGLLEQLADKGNGNYAYLDTFEEAYKVLTRQASATLITVAKDVKLQVEFNPAYAAAYRLLGYEDRALAAEDFKDDTKDAGEIGAGHSVTALYEIVPPESAASDPALVDELKYQAPRAAAAGTKNGELMTVKLRYKRPDSDTSVPLPLDSARGTVSAVEPVEVVVRMPAREGLRLSDNLGFSAAVAAFGMLLRNSPQSGEATWRLVADLATAHRGSDPDGYRAQFARLAEMAGALARTHESPPRR